eukprot:GHRR01030762.1.p1 GENE.GHRR01030762.1~~GHRR01030762.1.p1  ORF type:complete len:111 (+),score=11.95 GHRR01030762.1:191-523(+)
MAGSTGLALLHCRRTCPCILLLGSSVQPAAYCNMVLCMRGCDVAHTYEPAGCCMPLSGLLVVLILCRWQRIPQLRSEYDAAGQLVFRGPRLKMGVCEGIPRTIIPDHMGR